MVRLDCVQLGRFLIKNFLQIKVDLKTQAKPEMVAEKLAQTNGRVGCNPPISFDDPRNPRLRQKRLLGQTVNRDSHWRQELLQQHFTRVDVF